jgi:hypothetical protein
MKKRRVAALAVTIATLAITQTACDPSAPAKVVSDGTSVFVVPGSGGPDTEGAVPVSTWGSEGTLWTSPSTPAYMDEAETMALPSGVQPGKEAIVAGYANPARSVQQSDEWWLCSEWMPDKVSIVMPRVKGYGWLICSGPGIREYRYAARLERFVTAWHNFDYKYSRYGISGEQVIARPEQYCYNRPGQLTTHQAWHQRGHGWAYLTNGTKATGPYTKNTNRWFDCVNT